jgi:TP901 family phage tail tape measure protein
MGAGRFSVEAIFKAVDRFSAPVARMSGRVDRFAREARSNLRSVDSALAGVHGRIAKTGLVLAGAGVGAALAARSVLGAGADFEQAITNVGAVSLMTRKEIAALEKRALELGSSTKFSASEVAAGMELMGRAGFTNAQILSGIEGVLSAAAAEGAELAETASNISNVLKGMGLETSEATRVADVLTLASARTNSSISSLGVSMSNVAATAKQFKIPFEDTVAAVALLQDVGMDASEAGSAVNTMLNRLATPTDKVKAKMRALGVSFQDAKGDMLPLEKILENFSKAAKKSGGNMKQVAFFAELTELRGQKAAMQLKDLFESGKLGTLTEELRDAEGSAKKMADLRMNTLLGDWETLTGAVEGLKIKLFGLEGGPLRDVVKGWTDWIEANDELIVSEAQAFFAGVRKELPGIATGLKHAGRGALALFSTVRENLPEIILWTKRVAVLTAGFYGFAIAVKIARVGIAAVEVTMKVARGTAWLFGKAMTFVRRETDAATIANKRHAAAMAWFNGETTAAGGALGGLRDKLNASALGTKINGITSLMGKAGLLGAALAVGVAIGSWLDETFGLSDKLEEFMAEITGLKNKVPRAKKRGLDPTATRVYADIDRGYQPPSNSLATPLMNDFVDRDRPVPQIATPENMTAQQIADALTVQMEGRQVVDVNVKAEPGTSAEVTKSRPRKTRAELPASGRKR